MEENWTSEKLKAQNDNFRLQFQQMKEAIPISRCQDETAIELGEEDVALCEYVCTSKHPVQKTLRQGLNLIMEQG